MDKSTDQACNCVAESRTCTDPNCPNYQPPSVIQELAIGGRTASNDTATTDSDNISPA